MRSVLALVLVVMVAVALAPVVVGCQPQRVRVSGVVVSEDGVPVPGARVLFLKGGGVAASVVTGSDGRFEVAVEPGLYTVEVRARGYELFSASYVFSKDTWLGELRLGPAVRVQMAATGVEAEAGSVLKIPVVLENAGWEECEVSLSASAPEGWSVRFYAEGLSVTRVPVAAGRTRELLVLVEVPPSASGRAAINLTFSFASLSVVKRLEVSVRGALPPLVSKGRWFVVTPGTRMPLVVTLKNPLGRPAEVRVSVEAPEGWGADIVDPDTRLPVRGLSLPPEGSATLLLPLSVPEDAEEGVYVVAVRVSGDLEYAVNYTVTVVRGHTVKVFVPETAVATTGPYATFSVVLKNVGTRTEVVDVSVEGAPLGYRVLEGSTEVRRLVLMPGEERRLTVAIEVPPGEGNYTAVLRVGEQRITLTAFVRPVGRLRVLGPPAVVECAPGSACSFEAVVVNEGAATADVRLVVDAPAGLDVEVEPVYVAVLEKGGRATFRVTVRPLREGTYFLTLKAVSRDASSSTRSVAVEARRPVLLWYAVAAVAGVAAAAAALWAARRWGKKLVAFFRGMPGGRGSPSASSPGRASGRGHPT